MTRWMARFTGQPPTPGPAHAIRDRGRSVPSWHAPVAYCGTVASNGGVTVNGVTWQDVTDPDRLCPKCVRRMPATTQDQDP